VIEPTIGQHEKVTANRKSLRVATTTDPILAKAEKPPEADGSINVTDDDMWAPEVYDYANNQWKGAIVVANTVAFQERRHPQLDCSAGQLEEHRRALRDLAQP
jgi:hypothetical protein